MKELERKREGGRWGDGRKKGREEGKGKEERRKARGGRAISREKENGGGREGEGKRIKYSVENGRRIFDQQRDKFDVKLNILSEFNRRGVRTKERRGEYDRQVLVVHMGDELVVIDFSQ